MTAFVDTCLDTLSTTANRVQRAAKPRANRLLRSLAGKTNILITTHHHPDPDAAASCLGLARLLSLKRADAKVTVRFKGAQNAPRMTAFARTIGLTFEHWDDAALAGYDAIILLDTQPTFSVSPLPPGVVPTAIIDHHRGKGRRMKVPFADVRIDVGATASIVFSYFMELQLAIDPVLGAALLQAIESDIAGVAGHQSALDSIAISGLILVADVRKLWQLRYEAVPPHYFAAFARAVNAATKHDSVLIAHAGPVGQIEEAAMLADGLLRCEGCEWALVSGVNEGRLILSLRTSNHRVSAGEVMRRLVNRIGDGGGHRSKAGGQIPLETTADSCVDRVQKVIKRRMLRCLHVADTRGVRLAP
jgi:nanoRNase/pAp phosphatase (c-di-AMP/oligoRNAs hydrolase)